MLLYCSDQFYRPSLVSASATDHAPPTSSSILNAPPACRPCGASSTVAPSLVCSTNGDCPCHAFRRGFAPCRLIRGEDRDKQRSRVFMNILLHSVCHGNPRQGSRLPPDDCERQSHPPADVGMVQLPGAMDPGVLSYVFSAPPTSPPSSPRGGPRPHGSTATRSRHPTAGRASSWLRASAGRGPARGDET